MRLVCLDTHILIWGIKGAATAGQEEKVEVAQAFIQHLESQKSKAIIPSVVMAEFLVEYRDDKQRHEFSAFLDRKFMVAPFDTQAAIKFSEIWQKNHQNKSKTDTRDKVKFDYQIVSIAVTKGADCIYTHDKDLSKFARGFIETQEMPDLRGTQMDLPM